MRVVFDRQRGQRVPIYIWARSIDHDAIRQLQQIASEPYVVDHVAAMPDVHVAAGVAVGTVFATTDTLVPGALGGDLGCGMLAVKFDFDTTGLQREALEQLLEALGRAVPVGDEVHRHEVDVPDALMATELSTKALEHFRIALVPKQLGTLGGGNHFLELDRDTENQLWLVVHSGSRGLGGAIAEHHRRARASTSSRLLSGIHADSLEGIAYFRDATWANEFARANRNAICAAAVEVIASHLGATEVRDSRIDVHHNFISREMHQGSERWVHRKGATSARLGEWGLIPGSMGTATYVVRGLGAESSFSSCSHGAGRTMSRTYARKRITPDALERAMRRVVFDPRRVRSLVEEAPAAYRDIRQVLEDQRDLVEPIWRLEPLAVLKG